MISDTLAFFSLGLPEVLIIILFVMAIPVALIILLVIYVSKSSKEKQKLHQKMGELADELKRTQEQMQGRKKDESSV